MRQPLESQDLPEHPLLVAAQVVQPAAAAQVAQQAAVAQAAQQLPQVWQLQPTRLEFSAWSKHHSQLTNMPLECSAWSKHRSQLNKTHLEFSDWFKLRSLAAVRALLQVRQMALAQ